MCGSSSTRSILMAASAWSARDGNLKRTRRGGLETPPEGQTVLALCAAEARRDERHEFGARRLSSPFRFACLTDTGAGSVERRVVVLFVDVAADAVADGAANEHVREEVLARRVARHAHGRGEAVCDDLHRAPVVILVGDDGGERPC